MSSQESRLRRIRAVALLLAALSLAVVGVSAYLRLDAAGLGCPDWPGCYGRLLAGEPPQQHPGGARTLHRVVASVSLLLAGYLVWLCWRRPSIRPPALPATWLLSLMLALAALGIWSADPRRTWVGFLNILGGLGLVSFSWRVFLAGRHEGMPGPSLVLRLGTATLTVTVVLGALIGSGYAALACPTFPDCDGRWWPPAAGWAALRPFATLTAAPQTGDPAGVALHLLHRYSAAVTVLLLGASGFRALKDPASRKPAAVLLVLLAAEVTLGSLTVISGFNLWLALGHVACAAAMLAAVATLFRR